jgi:predicted nucleic acid-binding protein
MMLTDTGPLLAMLNVNDDWFGRCFPLSEDPKWDPVIPVTVLVELDYLIRRDLPEAAWKDFFTDVLDGKYRIEMLTERDHDRTLELCFKYEYLELQFADASMIAIAERLNITEIATIDRRDFRMIEPDHCAAFVLYPLGPDSVH